MLHLGYHLVSLLELLLDDFEFLWVSKCVLGANNFLKLVSKSSTLLHIEFHLNFNLLLSRAANVSLEGLNLVTSPLVLVLEVLDFALQVDD